MKSRTTMASLICDLERAEWFSALPFLVVGKRAEADVRAGLSFVSVDQYARGMVPRAGEIGYDGGTRFFKAGTKIAGRLA